MLPLGGHSCGRNSRRSHRAGAEPHSEKIFQVPSFGHFHIPTIKAIRQARSLFAKNRISSDPVFWFRQIRCRVESHFLGNVGFSTAPRCHIRFRIPPAAASIEQLKHTIPIGGKLLIYLLILPMTQNKYPTEKRSNFSTLRSARAQLSRKYLKSLRFSVYVAIFGYALKRYLLARKYLKSLRFLTNKSMPVYP